MYNTDLPRRADLPTSAQLRRSTLIAALTAAAILIFVVLPSEYGMDPTRVGRLLGLTEMGEIKTQLAREAALDASRAGTSGDAEIIARLDRIETLIEGLASDAGANPQKDDPLAGLIQQQRQTTPAPAAQTQQQATTPTSEWRDELSFVLTPGQGVEVKLVMNEGERARFFWTANGANVNYDTHGDGGGKSVSYEQGRGVPEQAGVLEAAFTGNHGWFWRNRTNRDVTITLRTAGQYLKINRMM
ncbi:hypothetical protein SAMN05216452_3839 [Nitratireductor aquibiodomus]|uniref:Transmembrane anchor protein n=1 Tax=Nitratireductor aquibiodomus TaxID=204799 RepID=A0A1H4NM22_9HYPH|nr:hypothetical protein [Nitratireductor aquibiodomus]SEB96174.1 hypothetical protein SAMN05216452_3839 [Nitratireductor aquibiodomus]